MNKKLIPLLLVLVALFQGCTGPEGPPGPEGGSIDVTGATFDLVGVNFTAANDFRSTMTYTDAKVTVLESDAVLVYIHWETVTAGGENLKVFRLLPQTHFFTNNGILTYNFDQTKRDFSIFLDGNLNLAALADDWTKNQDFRIVIVPADPARKSGSVDYNDYNAVVKEFNIDESKIRTVSAH